MEFFTAVARLGHCEPMSCVRASVFLAPRGYPLARRISRRSKTSMLQDVESGRKTEVEMFAGKVVRVADRHGLGVPLNRTHRRLIGVIEGSSGGGI